MGLVLHRRCGTYHNETQRCPIATCGHPDCGPDSHQIPDPEAVKRWQGIAPRPTSETATLVARLDGIAANAAGVMHTVHAAIEREAATALEQQQAEIERAEAALREYGTHRLDCPVWVVRGEVFDSTIECACGYEAALKQAASSTSGTGSAEQAPQG